MTFDCEAVLFDLDGVLVDSAECVERIWRRWAEARRLDPESVIRTAHGRRTIETVQLVAPHLDIDAEVAWLVEGESTETDGVYRVPGARALLDSLPAVSWAVVTSGVRALAESRIRHTGLPRPTVLVCADEISRGKPDPEGYLAAAQKLGVPPERCVVVEDAPPGIEAARAAGMRAIGIVGTFKAEVLRGADAVIPSLGWLTVVSERLPLEVVIRAP